MRVAPAGYLNLGLRAHELLRGVPLYDVSEVDLPGGGAGRNLADIRALRSAIDSSLIAKALFGTRYFLGRVFGWDRVTMRPDESLLSRLTDRDRMESQVAPGTAEGPFRLLYQFPGEALAAEAQLPQPSTSDWLVGKWIGTGTLLGRQALFTMDWSTAKPGAHLRLEFGNAFLDTAGRAQPLMAATALYLVQPDRTLTGSWYDSRGKVLTLRGTQGDSTLAIEWQAPEERGRTIYRLVQQGVVEVIDSVETRQGWREFGRALHRRYPAR